jgi:hypothetical protein
MTFLLDPFFFLRACRIRREFRRRAALRDSDFVEGLAIPADCHAVAVSIRRTLGRCWKIPSESIYHNDIFEELAEFLMITGWDELDFHFAFELEIGIKLRRLAIEFPPPSLWRGFRRRGPGTRVSEWISQVAPQARRQMAAS